MSTQIIIFGLLVLTAIIIYFVKCVFKSNFSDLIYTHIIPRYNFPLIRDSVKDSIKDSVKDSSKDSIKDSSKDSSKDSVKDSVKDSSINKDLEKYKTNDKIATWLYDQNKIVQPNNYLEIVEKLLKQLSNKKIDVNNLKLKEIDYDYDSSIITNFIHNKINELVKKEKYLQENGTWKYEYFYPKDPKFFYFQDEDNKSLRVIKLIYTLYNPLRNVSVDCIAFITEKESKLEIQHTEILNNWKHLQEDLTSISPNQKQNEIFYSSYFEKQFNKSGSSTFNSNLDYIDLNCDKLPIKIEADIPDEYKKDTVKIQFLPPPID